MTNRDNARIDAVRRTQGEVGNHVIDEFLAGRLSRRGFIRRGTVVGLSIPAIGSVLAACGSDDTAAPATTGGGTETTTGASTGATDTTAAAVKGGTLKAAGGVPSAASATLDPVLVNDGAGLTLISQVGQYLTLSQGDLTLAPSLATEWTPNDDASEWTFTLNPKATFSDGSPVTAADVVATMERLVNPDNKSNSLSAFATGKLSPGGTTAKDDATVVFKLNGPMGNFPYIVSSDNYNAIILPASVTDTTNFAADVIAGKIATSGPWTIKSFDATSGIVYVPNPKYWGDALSLEGLEYVFYSDTAASVAAFQSGEVDALVKFEVSGGESLFDNPDVTVYELKSANHRQVHLRTSEGPFANKAIRQAMAMAIDRQTMIDSLFQGKASIANDSPFFDVFPSSGNRPESKYDVAAAKALVDANGGGFDVDLRGITYFEAPDLAVLLQNAAKEIGINLNIQLTDDYYDSYWVRTYDPSVPGSDMGITDYGHRGVPDVYLNAPLKTFKSVEDGAGVWNSAEFANADYDAAVDEYSASADLQSQQKAAEKIQGILQDEVPMLIAYNINYLSATKSTVTGVQPTAMGHFFTDKASKA
ncbi:MAG: ABC transporter substrate-binding protein [Ilumatobacteraceae bacterium]